MPRKKKTRKLSFKQGILILITVFFIGWLAHNAFSAITNNSGEQSPFSLAKGDEIASPSDWVKENQIWVYNDKVIIWLEKPSWGKFTDTNSMDPFIDIGANSIEMKPESADDLNVGDIISYKSDVVNGYVIHRIIEKGTDDKGVYFIVKGDNNKYSDPGKIRFDQIQGVVVGVIY